MSAHYEIERKYLVKMPDMPLPCPDETSDIEQTYLTAPAGVSERVRARGGRYFHTVKRPVNGARAIEDETEVSRDEYLSLLERRDKGCALIKKTRHVFTYKNQVFELDIFDFWKKQAMLEIELADEAVPVEMPPFLTVLREVTDDYAYKNHSLSREIPKED